jgi:hypothetical protein
LIADMSLFPRGGLALYPISGGVAPHAAQATGLVAGAHGLRRGYAQEFVQCREKGREQTTEPRCTVGETIHGEDSSTLIFEILQPSLA